MSFVALLVIVLTLLQCTSAIPGAPVQNGLKVQPPSSFAATNKNGGTYSSVFGSSVAMSGDGKTAAVGLPSDKPSNQGVIVYAYSAGAWSPQIGYLLRGTNASTATQSQQGSTVALSFDGNTLASGSPNDQSNNGAIWVFTRSGTSWTQDGNKLFELPAANPKLLGKTLAISDDGLTIASSAITTSGGGGVVFVKSGGVWSKQGGHLTGSDATGSNVQGQVISLTGDGNTLFSSSPNDNSLAGCIFVFTRNTGGAWSQSGSKLTVPNSIQLGTTMSVSRDGMYLATAGSQLLNQKNNTIYVFAFTNGGYSLLRSIVGGANGATTAFGCSLSFDKYGDRLIIGDSKLNVDSTSMIAAGGFFQYDRSQTAFNPVGSNVKGTGVTTNNPALEGSALAISGDGTKMILGAPNDYYYEGAVWFFDATAATQGPTTLTPTVAPTSKSPTTPTSTAHVLSVTMVSLAVVFVSTAVLAFT